MNPSRILGLSASLALLALPFASARAGVLELFTIDSVEHSWSPERVTLGFLTATQNYYRVESAAHPFTNNVGLVRAMILGSGSATNWVDTAMAGVTNGYYRVQQIPRAQPLDLDDDGKNDAFELEQGTDPFIPQLDLRAGLVINEIDYDQPGTDTLEFMELYNNSTNTINLTGYTVRFINGSNNTQYRAVDLSGELLPGAFLILANSSVVVTNTATVIRFATLQDSIQNGSPDAVVVFNTTTSSIVDSLSYEGQMTAGVLTGLGTFNLTEGRALAVIEDNVAPNRSLVRKGNGQDTNDAQRDWTTTTTITPGYANVITP